jgi:hypothetical protein
VEWMDSFFLRKITMQRKMGESDTATMTPPEKRASPSCGKTPQAESTGIRNVRPAMLAVAEPKRRNSRERGRNSDTDEIQIKDPIIVFTTTSDPQTSSSVRTLSYVVLKQNVKSTALKSRQPAARAAIPSSEIS